MRNRTSQTFVAPDGRRETRIYPHSVNYRDGSGRWQQIDDTLVPDAASGFAWRNRANSYSVQLPDDLSRPVRFSFGSAWVSFSPDGARGILGTAGAVATYSAALPGVDARYTALPDGVREEMVLSGAGSQSEFRYHFTTSAGLSAVARPDGSIVFSDASGKRQFAFLAPVATDAAGSRTAKVSMTLGASGGSDRWVDVSVDKQWLSAPGRAFPVVVDPEIQIESDAWRLGGANQDCTITDQSPSSSACTGATDSVGYDGTHRWRTLMLFDVRGDIPNDATVEAAGFAMDLTAQSGSTAAPIDVYPVTRSWTTSATWNSLRRDQLVDERGW